jgi:hypothetical protein
MCGHFTLFPLIGISCNHLSDQYMKYQLEVPMYNNHLSDQYMKYQLEGTVYNNHLSDQYMKSL